MTDPTPMVCDPLVGWRDWKVDVRHGQVILAGVWVNAHWPRRQRMVARCYEMTGRTREKDLTHAAPAVAPSERGCGAGSSGALCGIYAMRTLELLERERGEWPTGTVARGQVRLWGVVYQHEKGFRAQYAYPLEITELLVSTIPPDDPERLAMLLEDGYGIPVGVVREAIGEPREK